MSTEAIKDCPLCNNTGYIKMIYRPSSTPDGNPIEMIYGGMVISARCPICGGK